MEWGPFSWGLWVLRVLVRQDTTYVSGKGSWGDSVGLGKATPSHGNDRKAGGRVLILKMKDSSTFPKSLVCGGLPRTAKAARTLAGLTYLKQGTPHPQP